MCDNIFNCTSLGFIYVRLCSPQASNNNNNTIHNSPLCSSFFDSVLTFSFFLSGVYLGLYNMYMCETANYYTSLHNILTDSIDYYNLYDNH